MRCSSPAGSGRTTRPRTSASTRPWSATCWMALRSSDRTPRHVALVTGLKHHLGPVRGLWKGLSPADAVPRKARPAGRRELLLRAGRRSTRRCPSVTASPGAFIGRTPVIGKAVGNAMNMGTTLAVYATICRETGRPFRFPGSRAQWNGLTDMTDARLLARHLLWATEAAGAANEAFNVVNGDVFRWSWMWGQIANWFGLEPAPFDGSILPLEQQMAHDAPVWRRIAERDGLAEPDLDRLSSPGTPMPILVGRSRSSPICQRADGLASPPTSRRMTPSSLYSGTCERIA